jgi:hypothetical protein
MTALSSVTSLPTSFVVFVATRVTWLVIVLTAREAVTGATVPVWTDVVLPVSAALVMLWIVRWK